MTAIASRTANLLFLRFSEIGWKNFDTKIVDTKFSIVGLAGSKSLRPIAYSSRLRKCGKAPVFMT
jgi:hypothetical protein